MTTHPKARGAPGGTGREFTDACAAAEIPATYRQWRKWERGEGLARRTHGETQKPQALDAAAAK